MKLKLNVFLALLLTVLTVKLTKVHTLECYYCEDASCDNLDDSKLGYCGPVTVETTEGTTVSEASTIGDGSTDDPQTPADTTSDTTLADTTTISADTATPPADTTLGDTTTASADTATPPADTTLGDTTTALADTATPPADTTLSDTTTALADTATPPADTTTITAETTIPAIESNVNAVAAASRQLVDTAAINPLIIRKRNAPNAADLLIRNYRAISRRRRDTSESVSYACYSIDVITDGISRVKRGCVIIPTEASGCEVVRVENSIPEGVDDNCYICLRDGCNGGSAAIQVSIALILSLLLSKMFV